MTRKSLHSLHVTDSKSYVDTLNQEMDILESVFNGKNNAITEFDDGDVEQKRAIPPFFSTWLKTGTHEVTFEKSGGGDKITCVEDDVVYE